MKKNNTKKVKAKSASKPKPAPRKSSISLKDKKSKSNSHTAPLASARKSTARPVGKTASRPIAPQAPAKRSVPESIQQKGVSQNGRQPVEMGRKQEKTVSEAKKPAPPPEKPAPQVKTHLTSKELKEFKNLLLAKREELAGDVENLTSEALNRKNGGVNEQSSMPIHMADLGSDTWEQDFTLGLIANEQALVREIDDALARIEDRTYGICVATDKPISLERLRAKPWAKYCIEYARLREEGRAP